MYQEHQLVEQLGIGNLPQERQAGILEELNYKIGQAIAEGYSEQQTSEYEAIVNDDKEVIDAWLAQNVPDYKNSPVYKELASGYDEDPEHVNPAKVFASLAWTQVNSPNAQEVVTQVIDDFKKELTDRT